MSLNREQKAQAVFDALTDCELCEGYRRHYEISVPCVCEEMYAEEADYHQTLIDADYQRFGGYYDDGEI